MDLSRYRAKRDFETTPEPAGEATANNLGQQFVVHEHHASRLHFDLRLELGGVLKSWAVPKGPSLDPAVKRLAVETEDHPIEYLSFEGVIPAGAYGAGAMLVWDRGVWCPEGDAAAGYAKGHLRFELDGQKLRGRWSLVRTKGGKHWLLMKRADDAALVAPLEVVEARPNSVRTGRAITEVRAAGVEGTLRDVVPAGDPAHVPGAVRRPIDDVAPQLASASSQAPTGDDWVAEVKHDGYRLLALKRGTSVQLLTRSGQDWTRRFPGLAAAVASLPDDTCLDGEAVVLDAAGKSDFAALQQAIGHDDARISFVAFDCLYMSGWDLRSATLLARKEVLRVALARSPRQLHYGEHIVGPVADVHREACAMGLEGTVAKRASAPYVAGRTRTWLKLKCFLRQELVIVGFTPPKGSRSGFGALVVAINDGELRYAGKVGTGFDTRLLRDLTKRLRALERPTSPLAKPPTLSGVRWVEPELVAEVAFREWTRDGVIRQSSFVGLREDKPAAEVVREVAAAPPTRPAKPRAVTTIEGVRLTHPDKIMFPDPGITKLELAEYYAAIAPLMLPYLKDRPLSLMRCPDGIRGACFYQKHARQGVPERVRRITIPGEPEPYLVIDDRESLLSLVHFGVIELHVRGARADALDKPDTIVLDLDPAPDVPWSRVVKTAIALRDQLDALGLAAFVRSTGGKGLHVVSPLVRRASWDDVKAFSHGLAQALAQRDPERFTARMAKAQRTGKIFIDYLRNTTQATAVASWSVRAHEGAPIARPLTWDELDLHKRPVTTIRDAIEADPWTDFEASRRTLTRRMLDAVASLSRPSLP